MNIEERIASYIQERDACQEAETKAHKRKVELTALIKKLNFALRDLKEILPEESSAETLKQVSNGLK
jgi:hypothetical protein